MSLENILKCCKRNSIITAFAGAGIGIVLGSKLIPIIASKPLITSESVDKFVDDSIDKFTNKFTGTISSLLSIGTIIDYSIRTANVLIIGSYVYFRAGGVLLAIPRAIWKMLKYLKSLPLKESAGKLNEIIKTLRNIRDGEMKDMDESTKKVTKEILDNFQEKANQRLDKLQKEKPGLRVFSKYNSIPINFGSQDFFVNRQEIKLPETRTEIDENANAIRRNKGIKSTVYLKDNQPIIEELDDVDIFDIDEVIDRLPISEIEVTDESIEILTDNFDSIINVFLLLSGSLGLEYNEYPNNQWQQFDEENREIIHELIGLGYQYKNAKIKEIREQALRKLKENNLILNEIINLFSKKFNYDIIGNLKNKKVKVNASPLYVIEILLQNLDKKISPYNREEILLALNNVFRIMGDEFLAKITKAFYGTAIKPENIGLFYSDLNEENLTNFAKEVSKFAKSAKVIENKPTTMNNSQVSEAVDLNRQINRILNDEQVTERTLFSSILVLVGFLRKLDYSNSTLLNRLNEIIRLYHLDNEKSLSEYSKKQMIEIIEYLNNTVLKVYFKL